MNERFDVVVVGSGAGGGVVAGELAERGRNVLLLELGPHRTAADFTRWETKAAHELWWPIRFALIDGGAGGAVGLIAGRCVGGSTTINTKVALRAHAKDFAKSMGDINDPNSLTPQAIDQRQQQLHLGRRQRGCRLIHDQAPGSCD